MLLLETSQSKVLFPSKHLEAVDPAEMSEQTPTQVAGLLEPNADQPTVQPTSDRQLIMVYDATGKPELITAFKEPGLQYNLISEACIGRLGHGYDPIGAEVFLEPVQGNSIEPIGATELDFYTRSNSKEAWMATFVVVRELWADIVLGKEECEHVAIERVPGQFPFLKGKMTEGISLPRAMYACTGTELTLEDRRETRT